MISSQLQATQGRTDDRVIQQFNQHSSLLSSIIHSQGELRSFFRLQASLDHQSHVPPHQPQTSTHGFSSNSLISIRAHVPNTKWYNCPSYCRCTCHQKRCFASPRLLCNALGTLFVGYSGYPLNTLQQCTEISCRAQRALKLSIHYIFPAWLLTKSLKMTLINTSLNEIHASLLVRRIVSPGSEVYRLVVLGDIDGLKNIFTRGLGSPNDIILQNGFVPLAVGRLPLFQILSSHILSRENRYFKKV